MCGIFCSISRHDYVHPPDSVQRLLKARGPDAATKLDISPQGQGIETFVTCYSTVLSLRGVITVEQPFQRPGSDSILCWNGEAWTIHGQRVSGNDTEEVFQILQQALAAGSASVDVLSKAFSQISGPYAFVFYHGPSSRIFIGRDFLGRRSLLWRATEAGEVLISSVAYDLYTSGWSEVEADGFYCLDLSPDSAVGNSHERWGAFSVCRTPFSFRVDDDNCVSVIPKISLNRHYAQGPSVLDMDSSSVSHLHAHLHQALSWRILETPEPPLRSLFNIGLIRTRIAILFSGGLDCTVLARLSHGLIPESEPIDLLNVAFENPRVHKGKGDGAFELCPDRITGRASHDELCRVCPGREWRFVAINVPYTEVQEHRQQIIDLMHPHNTEMDLSIATALYFAARGSGVLVLPQSSDLMEYETSARVLLSGLGADELFAGYTRHATAFNRNGFDGLLNELDLDIGRLGKRNLGRDDRVISHWGREARFPFLDERLVEWALATPLTAKCGFGTTSAGDEDPVEASSASIEPGKKVLRLLASRLGMKGVAREKKRAVCLRCPRSCYH